MYVGVANHQPQRNLSDIVFLLSLQQPWVQELIGSHKDSKLVFSADGYAAGHHLSTGLSQDHLVSQVA